MNTFIDSIRKYGILSQEEITALGQVDSRVVRVPPNAVIVAEGEPSRFYHILTDGFAAGHKSVPGNKRQVIAFYIPGDACDLNAVVAGRPLHGVTALMPSTLTQVAIEDVLALIQTYPRIAHVFWLNAIGQSAVLAEWVANLGCRFGSERVAHLVCEIFTRLRRAGLAREGGFDWPVTQVQIGDATGLSTVHVNRILRELKANGLLSLYGNSVVIDNFSDLKTFCGFDESYLTAIPDMAFSNKVPTP